MPANLLGKLLTTPEPVEPVPAGRGANVGVIMAAGLVGAWIFTFLMRRYLGLGATYDLFVNVQLATSWIEGRFLQDSFFGNYLAVHTYFLSPLLAIFAWPLGAPGLLLAAGLAVAMGVVGMVKILRLFGVPVRPALAYALLATLMPLSLQVYQVDRYGFQIELLIPCLALWLAFFLLQRKWAGSILLGLALMAMKEDAALTVVPVVAAVIGEDYFRTLGAARRRDGRSAWNMPAVTIGLVSVLLTPLLLYVVKSQPAMADADLGSFSKVHTLDHSSIAGIGSLWTYVTGNLFVWLRSATVLLWLLAVLAGTWGLILLRPHLLIVGVSTTLTAWLVQTDLLWAPRFAPTLAFIQLVGCLALASVYRVAGDRPADKPNGIGRIASLVIAGLLVCGFSWFGQYRLAPRSSEVYRLAPAFDLPISPADHARADELFGRYRRVARPEEPVIASEYLYRYIQDRNFFWYMRLRGRPKPAWILWDKEDKSLNALWSIMRAMGAGDVDGYKLFGENGRFLVYQRKSAAEVAREKQQEAPPIAGEPHGMIRMKLKIAPGRAGLTEPVLSIGTAGNGDLFFLRYLTERRLLLGMESVGAKVVLSDPIEFEPGREYELELFSGSLMEPVEAARPSTPSDLRRLYLHNLVNARWDGREVLHAVIPRHLVKADQVAVGVNQVRSDSAGTAFLGEISDVTRGGFPPIPDQFGDHGAVRLMVQLPAEAEGIPEPLVVVGKPGDAVLGYVRILPGGMIKVGVEFWGIGVAESGSVAADSLNPVEIIFSFPALYPVEGDPRWGKVPRDEQGRLRSHLAVRVNEMIVLEKVSPVAPPRVVDFAFGMNPAGGSLVNSVFTGRLLQVTRVPLDRR